MVQEQLVDYISSQVKLGVSREAIKSALVSAGWVAGDIDDTFKQVSKPAGIDVGSGSAKATTGSPAAQTIRVSDLVSAQPMASSPVSMGGGSGSAGGGISSASAAMFMSKDKMSVRPDVTKLGGKISGNSFEAMPAGAGGGGSGGGKKMVGGLVVMAILTLLFAGLAWYFYSGNAGFSGKVATLTAQSASLTTQLSAMQSGVDASDTAFAAQIASLSAANAALALNLSFYAAPAGASATLPEAVLPVTVSGWLSSTGKAYGVTTSLGGRIYIGNAADPKLAPQLKVLVGHMVSVTGTYTPGLDSMTMSSVTDLSPTPAPATASTSTSTASSSVQ